MTRGSFDFLHAASERRNGTVWHKNHDMRALVCLLWERYA